MTRRPKSRYRLAAVVSRVHRFLYVFFNGRFLTRKGNARFLLLTTTGRRSRRKRTVALVYLRHHEMSDNRESPAVIASFGGSPQAPGWLLNIRSDPKVSVQIGRVKSAGVARIAAGDERDKLWSRFVECFSGYERYQARTTRRFPIVIITQNED